MTIESPNLKRPIEAKRASVAEVISSLPQQKEGDRFAILSGDDEQVYIQALSTSHGFQLEYQDREYHAALSLYA